MLKFITRFLCAHESAFEIYMQTYQSDKTRCFHKTYLISLAFHIKYFYSIYSDNPSI